MKADTIIHYPFSLLILKMDYRNAAFSNSKIFVSNIKDSIQPKN